MDSEAVFKKRYDRLNSEQKQAVDTIDGPLMVIAGPGSGKTELLSLRVANILKQTDTDPRQILCLTFTDAAAVNMRKRLTSLIGQTAYRISINTFHTFGTWIIDRYPKHFYGGAKLQPADELTQIELMDEIIRDLDHDDPLRSYHPDSGFIYLNKSIRALSDLKQAGLTPSDFVSIITELSLTYEKLEPVIANVFNNRITKKDLALFYNFGQQLPQLLNDYEAGSASYGLITSLHDSYQLAANESREAESTKPITAWKNKYLKRSDGSQKIKSWVGFDKLISLSAIYQKYLQNMYDQGYFDFDDMILQSLVALRSNEDLLADLQEQFQYVLVDEFQDTNEAQLEIIKHIGSGLSNNNRPNIMTVGDDDQAIYRFQGAEVGNLVKFSNYFDQVNIITLKQNYRSSADIVKLSRDIISGNETSIEHILPAVTKQIKAFNQENGEIKRIQLPSQAHEFSYIAQQINRLINQGIEPSEIAIIGRRHRTLESLIPYLQEASVPTRYERQLDVLKEPHIRQIITIIRLLCSIADKDDEHTDKLLSEVIYYPFWGINEIDIWKLSVEANKKRVGWLQTMLSSKNNKLKELAEFLIKLSGKVTYEPVEIIIDEIVGTEVSLIPDDPDSEAEVVSDENPSKVSFSGFKNYYFSNRKYQDSKTQYLSFLSSLRVFIGAIREYRSGQLIKAADLVKFVDIHQENEKLVADTSPFINAVNAVNVMTAHKSKGQEFNTVFILSCIQSEWVPRNRGSDFAWPRFLNIGADADTNDDKLRLFYVALTRAAKKLYLTSYTHSDTGKQVEQLEFISELEPTNSSEIEVPSISDILDATLSVRFRILPELEADSFLRELLTNYKHSVTHLNNFIDVTKGGPQAFLEQNLLRFPHAKSASGAYGSAIHNTIDEIIRAQRANTDLDFDQVKHKFEEYLIAQRISRDEFDLYLLKGIDELSVFYPWLADKISSRDFSELNFSNQGVVIDEFQLTGKIDWLHFNSDENRYEIRDFKTGKPVADWKGSTDYEKIKLHKYRQQLLFYKILIDNSRDYRDRFNLTCGFIDFVQPLNGEVVSIEVEYDQSEIEELKKLIKSVCTHIHNLDFPDISEYPESIKGIQEFEQYLIDGLTD
jgi:DNA helicase-2/ATP-dependent DNA helicase PcrA